MRSFWSRGLLAALVVMITFLFPFLAPTPHRIDRAHCDLITKGMTKAQVEAIFGVPAGQYDWAEQDDLGMVWLDIDGDGWPDLIVDAFSNDAAGTTRTPILLLTNPRRSCVTWTSRHGVFVIWFDWEERVIATNAWTEVRIVPPWQRWWRSYWKK